MLRRVLLFATFLTAPAFAAPSEPSPAQIRHLAQSCTVKDAFGLQFGQKLSASTLPVGAEWAPVQQLSARLDDSRLIAVEATASFEKALMSNEDRIALARWVFRALDTEIQSGRHFAHREMRPDNVTYDAPGVRLALSQEGVVVHLTCAQLPA